MSASMGHWVFVILSLGSVKKQLPVFVWKSGLLRRARNPFPPLWNVREDGGKGFLALRLRHIVSGHRVRIDSPGQWVNTFVL
jgi:hypothetical protein